MQTSMPGLIVDIVKGQSKSLGSLNPEQKFQGGQTELIVSLACETT